MANTAPAVLRRQALAARGLNARAGGAAAGAPPGEANPYTLTVNRHIGTLATLCLHSVDPPYTLVFGPEEVARPKIFELLGVYLTEELPEIFEDPVVLDEYLNKESLAASVRREQGRHFEGGYVSFLEKFKGQLGKISTSLIQAFCAQRGVEWVNVKEEKDPDKVYRFYTSLMRISTEGRGWRACPITLDPLGQPPFFIAFTKAFYPDLIVYSNGIPSIKQGIKSKATVYQAGTAIAKIAIRTADPKRGKGAGISHQVAMAAEVLQLRKELEVNPCHVLEIIDDGDESFITEEVRLYHRRLYGADGMVPSTEPQFELGELPDGPIQGGQGDPLGL